MLMVLVQTNLATKRISGFSHWPLQQNACFLTQPRLVSIAMQLKATDLVSIGTQLLPKALSHAFGIQSEIDESPCFKRGSREGQPRSSSHRSGSHQPRKASPTRKRQHQQQDAAHDAAPADLPNSSNKHTAGAGGSISRQQPLSSLPQDPAMVQASASMQAASAMAQAGATSMQTTSAMAQAASMQTTSGMSAGHQRPHAVPASAAVMNSFRGFPSAVQVQPAAYRISPQTLLPYMGAALPVPPQAAMAMSNLTGSLGCAPLSVYSGPADYGPMTRAQQEEDADDTQARALKRPRLVWTPALHKLFEEAVQKLGLDKAVPKNIMQMMHVEGLTRENVASHLQKYRLGLKKSTDGDGDKAAAEGAEGADSGEAAGSGDKAGQQDPGTTSAAAARGSGGSGSSAGHGGGSSSSGADGSSSSSKGTGGAGADVAHGCRSGDAAGGGPAAAEGVGGAAGDRNEASSGQAAQQQQQQREEQQQQQGQQQQQQESQPPAAAVDQ